jgi:hypothetical protein
MAYPSVPTPLLARCRHARQPESLECGATIAAALEHARASPLTITRSIAAVVQMFALVLVHMQGYYSCVLGLLLLLLSCGAVAEWRTLVYMVWEFAIEISKSASARPLFGAKRYGEPVALVCDF